MERDPRIDDRIRQAASFARPVLEHLRELVHRVIPGVEEAIKWGMPHFTYKGKNIAGMAAFKAHCAFMIHGEGRQGGAGDAAGDRGGMGSFGRIARVEDLPPDVVLENKLRTAMERIDGVGSVRPAEAAPKLKTSIEMPADFAAALADFPTAEVFFAGLSASQRYDYLEWITGAKRPDTRANRIAEARVMLGEGKRRNWKYER